MMERILQTAVTSLSSQPPDSVHRNSDLTSSDTLHSNWQTQNKTQQNLHRSSFTVPTIITNKRGASATVGAAASVLFDELNERAAVHAELSELWWTPAVLCSCSYKSWMWKSNCVTVVAQTTQTTKVFIEIQTRNQKCVVFSSISEFGQNIHVHWSDVQQTDSHSPCFCSRAANMLCHEGITVMNWSAFLYNCVIKIY